MKANFHASRCPSAASSRSSRPSRRSPDARSSSGSAPAGQISSLLPENLPTTQQLLFRQIVDISTELERARVSLYAIDPLGIQSKQTNYYQEYLKGVPNQKVVGWPNLSLQVLAVHTGGEAINFGNDVPAEISNCIDDASAFYVVTIPRARTTTEKPDVLHSIQVKLTDPSLKPRTQFGYYAQP
jgi:hypothetical protein